MAEAVGHRLDIDPIVNYAFHVLFDETPVARFSGVDGLSAEVEMVEYRDSAHPNQVMYRQGRMKPARVTFKRGVGVSGVDAANEFISWIKSAENGTAKAKKITVKAGYYGPNNLAEQEVTWELMDCMPTKWSVGSLEGGSSSALIESLEVVVSSIKKS